MKLDPNFHRDFRVTYTATTVEGEILRKVISDLTFEELKVHTKALFDEDPDFTNKLYEQLKRRWAEEYGGDTEENESSNIGV